MMHRRVVGLLVLGAIVSLACAGASGPGTGATPNSTQGKLEGDRLDMIAGFLSYRGTMLRDSAEVADCNIARLAGVDSARVWSTLTRESIQARLVPCSSMPPMAGRVLVQELSIAPGKTMIRITYWPRWGGTRMEEIARITNADFPFGFSEIRLWGAVFH
jgi:hypothetical protein